jgi:phosphoglycerate-specific signal transduction histidine kinase
VDDEVVDALRDASSATRRLVDIVDDLHLLARLDDDDDGRLGPLHLASIVETAMSHVAARARARNVVLTSGVPSNLSVRGDASLLGRGLVALLDALVRGAPSSPSPMVLAISATTNSTESASSTVDVVLGLRADGLGDDAPTPSSELPGAGLGVLLAVRAVRACGGAIVLEPGAFVPRVSVRLPVRGDDDVG